MLKGILRQTNNHWYIEYDEGWPLAEHIPVNFHYDNEDEHYEKFLKSLVSLLPTLKDHHVEFDIVIIDNKKFAKIKL